MTSFKAFAWFVLAAAVASTLDAETRCPGNIASVPLRLVNGYQMIVAVSVNHSVPYDFLLDTRTQFSMIDPTLATELHVKAQGSIPVAGTGFQPTASKAQLDYLAIGSHGVANLEAMVYNVENLRSHDHKVRGILGEDFLQHFDMLIDNVHWQLCLDDSGAMRANVKGSHIVFAVSSETDDARHAPKSSSIADSIRAYEAIVQQSDGRKSGAAWWKLALLYQDAARFNEAERAYTNAIRLLKAQSPDALADVTDCMGTMYVQSGQLSKAEHLERDALTFREIRKDSLGVGVSWTHLSMLSLDQGHVSDAAMYAKWAVDQLLSMKNDDGKQKIATPEQKMSALIALALARCRQGMCEEALGVLHRARDIADSGYQTGSFPISYIDFLTGYAQWKTGNMELAAELMRRGAIGMQAELGRGHPTYMAAMQQYEHFLKQTGHSAEASELRRTIARVRESH